MTNVIFLHQISYLKKSLICAGMFAAFTELAMLDSLSVKIRR